LENVTFNAVLVQYVRLCATQLRTNIYYGEVPFYRLSFAELEVLESNSK
jgi:hypothetical protein